MYIEYKFNFFKFKILNADINSSLKYGILNKYRCVYKMLEYFILV